MRKAKPFAETKKGEEAAMLGMAMAHAIQKERRRNAWHFGALWAAIIAVLLIAVFS